MLGQEGRKIKRRWDFALSFTEDFIPSRYTTEAFSPLEVGLPVSQSCSWVMHRAGCEQHGPVLCPSTRSAISPLLPTQPARVPAALGGTSPCASPGFSPTAGRRSSISALQIIKLMNVSFFPCFPTALASNLCPDYD